MRAPAEEVIRWSRIEGRKRGASTESAQGGQKKEGYEGYVALRTTEKMRTAELIGLISDFAYHMETLTLSVDRLHFACGVDTQRLPVELGNTVDVLRDRWTGGESDAIASLVVRESCANGWEVRGLHVTATVKAHRDETPFWVVAGLVVVALLVLTTAYFASNRSKS